MFGPSLANEVTGRQLRVRRGIRSLPSENLYAAHCPGLLYMSKAPGVREDPLTVVCDSVKVM